MNPSQRIVLNTAATYCHSVIGVGLALFSSRWVLNALGQVDFGIFSLVGALVIFIAFLNTVMSASAGRHYAYAIGQGNAEEVSRWFNAAFSIHLCLSVVLILAGWPIGEYVIAHNLSIPGSRVPACLWVFRISLVSTFFGMVSIPFVAMFMAKQRIAEIAAWGMVQSVLSFLLAWLLTGAPGDRLLVYAFGMAAILTFVHGAQMYRAVYVFPECVMRPCYWFERSRLLEIFSFAVWNLIGSLGSTLRNQGSAILLNLFFGTKVNAAYGIANQVSSQTNKLSAAMTGAFVPEITSSEGRGDRARMLSLSLRTCKFGTILTLLFAVPLIIEMDYVLELWLREPPAYTAVFCKLILCTILLDRLSVGYMVAVNAHGRIAAYQAILGTILVLTLPLAWAFLKAGYAPTSVGMAFVITMAACSMGRVLWVRWLFALSVKSWIGKVVIPSAAVAALSAAAALIPVLSMPASFMRLVLSTSASIATSLLATWFLALDESERGFAIHNVWRFVSPLKL